MKRNNTLLAIFLILAIIIGAFLLTMFGNPQNSVTSVQNNSTKLEWTNNGTTWLHIDAIYENVTCKNGSIITFYTEMYIKANSSIVVDLSQLAGYNNEKLPPGTNITILAWKGLINDTNRTNVTQANLNLTMQGWSNTRYPQAHDPFYNIFYPGLDIDKLPENVTDNLLFIAPTIEELHILQSNGTDDNETEPIYEVELLHVNSNGTVTLTFLQIPELCRLAAHII